MGAFIFRRSILSRTVRLPIPSKPFVGQNRNPVLGDKLRKFERCPHNATAVLKGLQGGFRQDLAESLPKIQMPDSRHPYRCRENERTPVQAQPSLRYAQWRRFYHSQKTGILPVSDSRVIHVERSSRAGNLLFPPVRH